MGFGVWGLGFGVWGLGFGVLGLGGYFGFFLGGVEGLLRLSGQDILAPTATKG